MVADALTLAERGVHPLTVVSAIVDQDSTAVRGVTPVDPVVFTASLKAALEDGQPSAVKVGLVPNAGLGTVLASAIARLLPGPVPIVVDPVLSGGVSSGETALADTHAYGPLLALALDRTVIITPNAHELGALVGAPAPRDVETLEALAIRLAQQTGALVLAKGGHVDPPGTDVLVTRAGPQRYAPSPAPREDVHGTGCRLSSLLAAALALGADVPTAVTDAREAMRGSFAARVAKVGAGRPQFVPAAALLHRTIGSDIPPGPLAPQERSE